MLHITSDPFLSLEILQNGGKLVELRRGETSVLQASRAARKSVRAARAIANEDVGEVHAVSRHIVELYHCERIVSNEIQSDAYSSTLPSAAGLVTETRVDVSSPKQRWYSSSETPG